MNFSQGLSGLNAASQKMDAVSNNIANSHTIGYKKSNLSFSDMMAGSKIGAGVQISGIHQNFNNGVLETSQNALDLAIDGNGFFRLDTPSGNALYSRNGQFQTDNEGFITNGDGMYLMGYKGIGEPPTINQGSEISRLKISMEPMAARITDGGFIAAKLNSQQPNIATGLLFSPQNGKSYSAVSRMKAYDSLGQKHDIDLYYIKNADNQWTVYSSDATAPAVKADAQQAASSLKDDAQQAANNPKDKVTEFQKTAIQFDSTGRLSGENSTIRVLGSQFNGATALDFQIDLSKLTQGAIAASTPIAIDDLHTSGYEAGLLSSYAVDENGIIEARYSNNETQQIGQVLLSRFMNNDGLSPQGHHCWAETRDSGSALHGSAGTSNLGKIYGKNLESSNVDLSQEIISLIQASFFSNANMKTISTMSESLQKLCNIG